MDAFVNSRSGDFAIFGSIQRLLTATMFHGDIIGEGGIIHKLRWFRTFVPKGAAECTNFNRSVLAANCLLKLHYC
jgi:hypothetical protein